MEIRRAADALLRCNASPLATLFTRPTTTRWATRASITHLQPTNRRTASQKLGAFGPVASSSPPEPSAPDVKTEDWEADLAKVAPPSWAQPPTRNRRSISLSPGNAADDLFANLLDSSLPGAKKGRVWDPIPSSGDRSSLPSDLYGIMQNTGISGAATPPKPPRHPMRLTASTGRTVGVSERMDITRSFRVLEISCAKNRVKQDFNYQRFHERPGMKRKRLHRQRYRQRFLAGFKAHVARVREVVSQGW